METDESGLVPATTHAQGSRTKLGPLLTSPLLITTFPNGTRFP